MSATTLPDLLRGKLAPINARDLHPVNVRPSSGPHPDVPASRRIDGVRIPWRRALKAANYTPLCPLELEVTARRPHDSYAHDLELLETRLGPVSHLSGWHYYGRAFRLADGREGYLDAARAR